MTSDAPYVLYVLVGLPRSGKSTWVKENAGGPIVNPDSIRLAMHGQRYIPEAEPFIWAVAPLMVKSLFLAGHQYVYIDATNTTAKRRSMWISSNWVSKACMIDTPIDVCIERAKSEGDEEIIPVIERMAKNFEEITEEEGFAYIDTYSPYRKKE